MVTKVNGISKAGEFITGGLDYFLIRTTVNITPGNFGDTSQNALEVLLQTFALRGQPVILGTVFTTTETSPADLTGASGSVTVYNIRLANEHKEAWALANSMVAGSSPSTTLQSALAATGTFTAANTSVCINGTFNSSPSNSGVTFNF